MKVAQIVPPKWVNRYPISTYAMALAHWVNEYKEYGENMRANAEYLILDNGAFEGRTQAFGNFKDAIAKCRPDEIVLPDIPGDGKGTLRLSWAAFEILRPQRCMFVPQGKSYEEWTKCLTSWMKNWGERDEYLVIGITPLRKLDSTVEERGRRECLEFASLYKRPIHLLGLASPSYFIGQILSVAQDLGVRGLDTSIAFALGANNVLFDIHAEKINLGNPNQYDGLTADQRRLGWLNMAILDYLAKSEYCDTTGVPMSVIGKVASKWTKYWLAGFANSKVVMQACGMPSGRYDVFSGYVFQLLDEDDIAEGELVIL